jgi:hypothetical protein
MEYWRICEDCSAIFRNRLKRKAIFGVPLGDEADFVLRKTLQKLKESKSQSCEFCEQLCSIVEFVIDNVEISGGKRPSLIAKTLYGKDTFSFQFSIMNSDWVARSWLKIVVRGYSETSSPSFPIYAMLGELNVTEPLP